MAMTQPAGLAVCLLAGLLLAGCQASGTAPGAGAEQREGYFTWVDEQGRVRYSRIPEATSDSDDKQPETSTAKASVQPEANEPSKARKLEDAGDYTPENYPDGEALARDGFIRPGQRQPYFTWRDAEGNVRVSYYKPDFRSERERNPDQAPLNLTPASVYLPEAETAVAEPVEGHDPDAFAVLGIEASPENRLSEFASSCCEELANRDYQQWQEGREFGVRLTEDSGRYSFSSGESPFALIALPEQGLPGFVMRLRSYEHGGVFVPSLAFLDKAFRPVRLVTDLVMDYHPETWRKRGYLEAWVPVLPGEGERWLLVYTRDEDLAAQTVHENGQGPRAIPHISHGELGVATFEE